MKEAVNHPEHYQGWPVECIDIAEHLTFNAGNALKYLWRAGRKNADKTLEDVKKALWYLKREKERVSKLTGSVSQVAMLEVISQSHNPLHKAMGQLLAPSSATWGYEFNIDQAITILEREIADWPQSPTL